jgi:hypothetical protein
MLSIKQLNQKISGIRTSAKALRENIHVVLCNAAGHAFEHGDVTPFTKLFEATSGVNRKRIAAWVRDNGFATLQKDGTFKVNKAMRKSADFEHGDDVVNYLLNDVAAWYVEEEKAAQITKELDICARIQSVINSASKGDAAVKPVDFEQYRALRAQLDALVGAA